MNVIVAESAGFCFGVQRAVSICEKAAGEYGNCVTLGPIIHNENVVRSLEEKGIRAVSGVAEVTPGMTVILRAHGTGIKDLKALEEINVSIIDATCPDVRRIHNIVRDESDKGRLVAIVGDRGHPEVVAISGCCSDFVVFESAEELVEWLENGDNAQKPVSFVFQTTNARNIYHSFVEIIKKECTNYNIFDTICDATRKRQQEAEKLSGDSDVMVVVGDKNSANSLRLADICREHCRRVLFVAGAEDLVAADICQTDTVGITAGASTPAWIIKEVTQIMIEDVRLDETEDESSVQSTVDSTQIGNEPEATDVEAVGDERLTINDEEPESAEESEIVNESEIAEEPEIAKEPEDEGSVQFTVDNVQMESDDEAINDERLTINDEEPESVEESGIVNESEIVGEPEIAKEPEDVDSVQCTLDSVQLENDAGSAEDAGGESDSIESSTPESFEEMLEKSIKTLHTGQKVTGVVTSITATEVSVDLGAKQSGYIPISEFTEDPNDRIEDIVRIGDQIESFVMRVNDVEGMIMLSKKRLDAIKNWDEIEAAKDSRAIVEGIVTEENKGGVVVNVKGVRVFIPASQTGLAKSAPMSALVKKTVRLRITEVNQSRRRVVGSIRAVQADERREKSDRLWEEIETGKQYDGVVKSMTSYGVFVDIGGVDGMIHISELSWTRIKQPSEVMSVGDEVSVYVLSFDKDNKKISLGYKKKEDNPWAKFTTQFSVGDITNVKVVKMMPFGAFAEICPGVDGLIHISQITDHRIGLPSEVLSDGQLVDVKITEIDYDRKKVSLSIRALIDPTAKQITDAEAADAISADKTPVVVYDTDAPPETINDEQLVEGEDSAQSANDTESPETTVEEAEVITEAEDDGNALSKEDAGESEAVAEEADE